MLPALSRCGWTVGSDLQVYAFASARGGQVAHPAAVSMLPGSRPRRPCSGLLPRLQVGSVSSSSINVVVLAKDNCGALAVNRVFVFLSCLLVTAGEDRYVKTWNLGRLHHPIIAFKRSLTNEIYWPLNASGIMMAQDNVYTA